MSVLYIQLTAFGVVKPNIPSLVPTGMLGVKHCRKTLKHCLWLVMPCVHIA